jgi:hypothetical protein
MCQTAVSLPKGVKMKQFLYITILGLTLSVSAYADTWTMPNNAGGQIVLSDRKCSDKYPVLFQMFSRGSDGVTLNGCWAFYDGYIHVVYDDRSERTYDPRDFTKLKSY